MLRLNPALPLLSVLMGISGCAVPLAPNQEAVSEYSEMFSDAEVEAINRKEERKRLANIRYAEAIKSEENAARLAAALAHVNERGGE